jgi:hypothetical protein
MRSDETGPGRLTSRIAIAYFYVHITRLVVDSLAAPGHYPLVYIQFAFQRTKAAPLPCARLQQPSNSCSIPAHCNTGKFDH